MVETTTIRPATPADLPILLELLGELFAIEEDFCFDADHQRKGLELLLACPSAEVFVAERDGAVIGMCTGQMVISTAEGAVSIWVEDVVVHRGHRGTGVGSALLTALSTWARRQGATRLQLLADRTNEPALRFYRARGWADTQLICLRASPAGPDRERTGASVS
jgi:GNAT superfamily N-acetyltransferase